MFLTWEEFQAYQNQQEANRQAAVVVIQAAKDALRAQLGELLPEAEQRPHSIEILIILEDGEQGFFGNRKAATGWARAQNKTFAVCEIRSVQLVELSEAEVAARVAAL